MIATLLWIELPYMTAKTAFHQVIPHVCCGGAHFDMKTAQALLRKARNQFFTTGTEPGKHHRVTLQFFDGGAIQNQID